RRQPRLDQVLHDLRLAVDHDRLARQRLEVEVVPLAGELQVDAAVDDSLPLHALADARVAEEAGGSLLEHPRADPRLDVLATAVLEHDRVDAFQVEQVREHQPGRAGADDADLRPHQPSSSTRWAILNAELAAGTPQ